MPSGNNMTGMTLAANWTWGPLFLAATYDVVSPSNTTTPDPATRR